MITLYDYELSAECYQARLMLAVLRLDYSRVDVELYPGREHESEWFTELSPLGQLPVLRDDETMLWDVHAILGYLASRYDPHGKWYPIRSAEILGQIGQWLGFARAFACSAGAARLHENFLFPLHDIGQARARAHQLFRILDDHLWFGEQAGRDWLCAGEDATIADIALFPDVALSEEGGISRIDYPAVRRWTDRVRLIDGFSAMSGIFRAGAAR